LIELLAFAAVGTSPEVLHHQLVEPRAGLGFGGLLVNETAHSSLGVHYPPSVVRRFQEEPLESDRGSIEAVAGSVEALLLEAILQLNDGHGILRR